MENLNEAKTQLDNITDEEKEAFAELDSPKDKLELLWNHTIFNTMFEKPDCFESGKDEKSGDIAGFFADQLFKEGKYESALEFYNKGVIFSKNKSENFKKCLTNRSACLSKLKKFDLAIQDCDLLTEDQVQDEKTFVIIERKIKCLLVKKDLQSAKNCIVDFKKSLEKTQLSSGKKQKLIKSLEQSLKKCSENEKNEKNVEAPSDLSICISEGERHPIFEAGSNMFDVVYTEEKGRHAVATRDIKVGEVILVERPVTSAILPAQISSHCHQCYSVVEAPLPCSSCTLVVYCSPTCRQAHATHKWACGNKLLPNMEHSRLSFQLITHFGIDHILSLQDKLVDQDPKWAANCENAPKNTRVYASDDLENAFHHGGPSQNDTDLMDIAIQTIFLLKCLQRKDFFAGHDMSTVLFVGQVMVHITNILPSNAHGIGKMIIKDANSRENKDRDVNHREVVQQAGPGDHGQVKSFGVALYNTLSLFNHSCNSSFARFNQGNQVICVATKNIKRGSELYENYGVSCLYHTKEFRQRSLLDRYGFECTCEPCSEDWSVGAAGSNKARNVMLTLHKAVVQKMWIKNGNKQFVK